MAARFTIRILFNPYRSVLMGMATGMAVWLVLFLPVTMLLVQPFLARPGQLLDESLLEAGQSVWGIALSAIAFHIIWGAIFGYVVSALMRIRAFKIAHQKEGAEK
jgi:hypothetical protein